MAGNVFFFPLKLERNKKSGEKERNKSSRFAAHVSISLDNFASTWFRRKANFIFVVSPPLLGPFFSFPQRSNFSFEVRSPKTMYLLKPYLTCVGMLLVVASYFMMFHPTEAVLKYLQVVSSTKEEAASWSKAFLVESTRSSMWQSPIFPMIIHLVQAGG